MLEHWLDSILIAKKNYTDETVESEMVFYFNWISSIIPSGNSIPLIYTYIRLILRAKSLSSLKILYFWERFSILFFFILKMIFLNPRPFMWFFEISHPYPLFSNFFHHLVFICLFFCLFIFFPLFLEPFLDPFFCINSSKGTVLVKVNVRKTISTKYLTWIPSI